MGARLLRIFARSQGLFFQRRPRSRRSSNEVAPSAGGGGGARDLRSRFSSSSPVLRVASVRKGKIWAEKGGAVSRLVESPSSAWGRGCPVRVPSGTAPEDELSLRIGRHVEQLRLKESREPPPPRAVRGAARHSKAGVFSAKAAGVGPQEGLAKLGSIGGG